MAHIWYLGLHCFDLKHCANGFMGFCSALKGLQWFNSILRRRRRIRTLSAVWASKIAAPSYSHRESRRVSESFTTWIWVFDESHIGRYLISDLFSTCECGPKWIGEYLILCDFFYRLHVHNASPICVTCEQNQNWVTFAWQCKHNISISILCYFVFCMKLCFLLHYI